MVVLSAGCLVSGVPPLTDLVVAVVGLRVEVVDMAGFEVELLVVGLDGVEFEVVEDRAFAVSMVTALSASQTFLEMKSAKHGPRGTGRGLTAVFGLTLVKPSASWIMPKKAFSESPVFPSSRAAMTLGAGSEHLLAMCPGLRQRQQTRCSTGTRGFGQTPGWV